MEILPRSFADPSMLKPMRFAKGAFVPLTIVAVSNYLLLANASFMSACFSSELPHNVRNCR